jgi:hypothetical protein
MAFAFIGFLMTSCGESEICNCVSTELSMLKEIKEANAEGDKMDKIEEKYNEKSEKCSNLVREMSKDERKKLQEASEKCPEFKEAEKLREEFPPYTFLNF